MAAAVAAERGDRPDFPERSTSCRERFPRSDILGHLLALRPLPGAYEVTPLRLALSRHDDGDHVVAYRVHVAVVREVEQTSAPHYRELGLSSDMRADPFS